MAVLMTQDIPATPDQYDEVNQKMGVTDNPPDGLLIHTARQSGDGMRIVDVWESEDAYNKFRDAQLLEAVEAVLGPLPEGAEPNTEFQELHNVISGS